MAGKSKEYWNRRYLMDKALIINGVEDYLAGRQREIYAEAGREIRQKIETFYARYAKDNRVSLSDARIMLRRTELGRVDWERFTSYNTAGADGLPDDIVAAMEKHHMEYGQLVDAISKKGSISRLQLLQAELDKTVLDLYDANQLNIYSLLADEYENVYYKSLYNTQQCIGYGSNFAALNKRAVDTAILNRYTRGNYSERIWAHTKNLSSEIRKSLTVGMITGENLDKMARRLQKRLDVSASNARRLVRTETAYVYEQATGKAYQECGIEKYEYLATLDYKTSPACRALDGKIFAVKDAMPGKNYPPMHPNCRSTTVCAFEDDRVTARLARDGKYYEVPSDMTYKQWQQIFVDGDDKLGLQLAAPDDTIEVKKEIKAVSDTKTFGEMRQYMQNAYGINIDKDIDDLDFKSVNESMSGVEIMLKEFPQAQEILTTISTSREGVMCATNHGVINFNPFYYHKDSAKDRLQPMIMSNKTGHSPKNSNIASIGAHEMGHILESALIKMSGTPFDNIAWNKCREAKVILNEAYKLAKKTPEGKGLKNFQLTAQVSQYALEDASECLAECCCDYVTNRGNASTLSKEVWKLLKERLG